MDKLKSLSGTIIALLMPLGFLILLFLFFSIGTKVAFTIAPFINLLAGILFIINIFALLIAIAPRARKAMGSLIFFSSYVYGISLWIYGLTVSLALWGLGAVIIGLVFAGVGVVPIGILASVFKGEWGIFWSLIITAVLTYGARMIGMLLLESETDDVRENRIIDIDEVDVKRKWEDFD